jgi:HEAT repeat protein
MEELQKIKEEIEILKFATEDEFNSIRKQFEITLEFIKSQNEVTSAINNMTQENVLFVKDVYEKFEIKNIEINTLKIKIETLETLIRTQNIKIETLEYILNLKK